MFRCPKLGFCIKILDLDVKLMPFLVVQNSVNTTRSNIITVLFSCLDCLFTGFFLNFKFFLTNFAYEF